MKLYTFAAPVCLIILLVPLMNKGDGKPMSAQDVISSFAGNTVISKSEGGIGYAFVKPGGKNIGVHPEHGKLTGSWHVDSEGEVCVTWLYPDGSITNCAPVFKTGDNSYKFGDREFTVQAGDVKGLGQ